MKHKRHIKRDRLLNMYASLWHTSWCLLEAGKAKRAGSYHAFLSSIVFSAFTFEAYLNHVGAKLFTSWDDIDTLSPESKLKLICERLHLTINHGVRPWQTLRTVIRVRNRLAHGRTMSLEDEYSETYDPAHEPPRPDFIQTEWEKLSTAPTAERVREDVQAAMEMIHAASGASSEDYLFAAGTYGLNITWMGVANPTRDGPSPHPKIKPGIQTP
jgi:hypothetical protein